MGTLALTPTSISSFVLLSTLDVEAQHLSTSSIKIKVGEGSLFLETFVGISGSFILLSTLVTFTYIGLVAALNE